MAAVVASEYKTNDHFVHRGSQIHNGSANWKVTGSLEVYLKCDFN